MAETSQAGPETLTFQLFLILLQGLFLLESTLFTYIIRCFFYLAELICNNHYLRLCRVA